jgi:hypothetical protein
VRKSQEQWKKDFDKLSTDNAITAMALNVAISGKFSHKIRKGNYTVRLANLTNASGGILVLTFHPKGQKPHSAAYYAEQWAQRTIERYSVAPPGKDDTDAIDLRWLASEVRLEISGAFATVQVVQLA